MLKWLAQASGIPDFTGVVLMWQKKMEERQTFQVPNIPKWTQKFIYFVDECFAQQNFYTGSISKGWHAWELV